ELHGEVGAALVLTDLVDGDDVVVPHARHRLRLDPEAGPLLRAGQGAVADHLERDQPILTHLAGPVNHAHAAPPQLPKHLVPGHDGPLCRSFPGGLWGIGCSQPLCHRVSSSRSAPVSGLAETPEMIAEAATSGAPRRAMSDFHLLDDIGLR